MADRPRTGPLLAILLAVGLTACGVHDEKAGLDRTDYEGLLARRGPEQARPAVEPPIPDLQPVLAAPTPPGEADQRRVTISVTEQTPLRDVLIELARKAEVELELDPRIEGGIIFSARNRPFAEVARRIADLAGLRYSFEDNVLRMELDEPYTKNYRVDVLNLKRSVDSQIGASTDVFAAVGESSSSGGNGSQATITNAVENDFWTEVQKGVEAIISETTPAMRMVAAATQAATTAAAGPPSAAAGEGIAGMAPGSDATAGQTPLGQAQDIANQTGAAVQAEAAGGATPPAAAAGTAEEMTTEGAEGTGQYYTINRQAGVIGVYATDRAQKKIAEYLDALTDAIQGQVLIEAKVIEVSLKDAYRAGIDWQSVGIDDTYLATNLAPDDLDSPTFNLLSVPAALNFSATINLLKEFGTTRTLSSPRLTVTNNETSMLKVAENEVYFNLEIETEIDDETGNRTNTYTSELNTVPIGFLMTVQPSINRETNRVALNLRPTISRVVDRVEDPAVQLVLADINASNNASIAISSTVPVVEIREMDSVVTMESGSILVMGGLMQERSENTEQKVPVAGDIPLIGNAFRSRDDATNVVELVILIRATIIRDAESVHPADVDLYNKFAPDPRPFGF
jgi:general secretion pathway protein D